MDSWYNYISFSIIMIVLNEFCTVLYENNYYLLLFAALLILAEIRKAF